MQTEKVASDAAGAAAQVIEMPSRGTEVVQLTTEERLRLENVQLKMELGRRQYASLVRELTEEQERIAKEAGERAGVDLHDYDVDLTSGACRKKENADGHKD